MHGEQGESGVCAWKVAGSCSREERLLIPPTISNSGVGGTRPVILQVSALGSHLLNSPRSGRI